MKPFYLVFALTIFYNFNLCYAVAKAHEPVREKLEKYDFKLEHTLKLEAKTGQRSFIQPDDLAKLKGQKIHHIDIVYSAYTGLEGYTQDQLNLKRISILKRALPQVAEDKPTWKYIEQTGPKSLAEAKTYFHGFIVHFGPKLDYQHLKSFFKPFQTPHETYTVSGKEGGQFKCGDGSAINIMGESVTYADGTPVEGDFTIEYKEFKDPADILFSGIPMTFDNGNEQLNFSSVGMYDMRASQDGKQLDLKQPAEVDFNCTAPEAGVSFYQMNDETGDWTMQKEVSYGKAVEEFIYTRKSKLEFDGQYYELNSKVYANYSDIHFDEASWDWFFKHFAVYPNLKAMVQEFDESEKTVQSSVQPKEFVDVMVEIMVEEKKEEIRQERLAREEEERQRQKEQAEKMAKIRAENQKKMEEKRAAQAFTSSIVNGLSSPDFGVYNCDQVYRMEEPLALSPTYSDESGTEITSKHVVYVMDLNYNGAFSFHPNNITCSGVGKNVIVLFTDDKHVYMLSQDQFAGLNLDGNLRPQFKMKNMTGVIKSADDLKLYLKS